MSREIPAGLAASLASGCMSLATCYIVTRRDGVVFGFSDHDRPLQVLGVDCRPEGGFDASTIDETLGASTDGTDIMGAIDDARITRADIVAGLWDGAEVRVFVVDWTAPDVAFERVRLTIAEIQFSGARIVAQLRSALAAFNQERGRLLEHDCPFDFGDSDCGFDVAGVTVTREVRAVSGDWIELADVAGQPDGTYDLGRLVTTTGEIAHVLNHTGPRLTLFAPFGVVPGVGDEVSLARGCDKSFATCRAYENERRYGGFPFMLGTDVVIQQGRYEGQLGGVSQFLSDPPPAPANVVVRVSEGRDARISFDPVPFYVTATGAAPVYGLAGQIMVGGLGFNRNVTITLRNTLGDLASDPVSVSFRTGPPPPRQGGDGGGGGDGVGGDNDGGVGGVDGNDPDGDGRGDTGL